MLGINDLGLFIASGLLLNLVPGPDTLIVVARSAGQGFRAGSAAALGIGAGTFVHVFAAALGMSALLAASAAAFDVVKYAGAAYLVCIGMHMMLARHAAVAPGTADVAAPLSSEGPALREAAPAMPEAPPTATLRWRAAFGQGFLTNVLNPKVALFTLAFVPQFIDAQAPSKALAFVALGVVFNVGGMLWLHGVAYFAAAAGRRVRVGASTVRWLNRAVGLLFVSFGIKLALVSRA
jgi:threonine/homoserine/homoserine lactone efflux protein